MDAITIRVAGIDERSALEALQRRASLANAGDSEALLEHPDAIELPAEQIARGHVYVAESSGAIVGFAALVPEPGGHLQLDGLFVDPDHWRNGIGRALMDHMIEIARGMGALAIEVVANPHARGFYESCGFEIVGSASTRFGPGLLMTRRV